MEFFEIAKILKPQGIRGELKLECYVRDMEHFSSVSVVYMKEGHEMRSFDVERIRISGDNAFITIEGCHDRNTAETLRNRTLYIDRKDAYPLEEDEDYIADLIGLEIIDDLAAFRQMLVGQFRFTAVNGPDGIGGVADQCAGPCQRGIPGKGPGFKIAVGGFGNFRYS